MRARCLYSDGMQVLAGIQIERGASGTRLTTPRSLPFGPPLLIAMLAAAAWLTASFEDGVGVFMAVDFVLWCWVAATVQHPPLRPLRRSLEIPTAVERYRGGEARGAVVDGRSVSHDRIAGAWVVEHRSRRSGPSYAVYFVAQRDVVPLAATKDREQAIALARLVHTELGMPGEPAIVPDGPGPGGVGCAASFVLGLILLGAYLAVVGGLELMPAWRLQIAIAGAVLHGLLAIAMRAGIERVCAGATRRSVHRIFGVEG